MNQPTIFITPKNTEYTSGYHILLEPDIYDPLKLNVLSDGISIPLDSRLIPTDLKQLLKSFLSSKSIDKNIIHYLIRQTKPYPLLVKTSASIIELQLDSDLVLTPKIELTLKNQNIYIKRLLFAADSELKNYCFLAGALVFDKFSGKVCQISHTSAWKLWEKLLFTNLKSANSIGYEINNIFKEFQTLDTPLIMSQENFNKIQLSWHNPLPANFDKNLSFKIEKKTVAPINLKPELFAHISETKKANEIIINMQLSAKSQKLNPAYSLFKYFSQKKDLPFNIPRRFKKNVLYSLILLTLNPSKNSALKFIQNSVNNPEYNASGINNNIARFLVWFYSEISKSVSQLMVIDNNWYFINTDLKKQAMLYAVPYKVFNHHSINETSDYSKFSLPKEQFFQNLTRLKNIYQKNKISLFYQDRPILKNKWHISLDFSHKLNGWLSIKPEIKDDLKSLSLADCQRALQNHGLLFEEKSISLIDKTTLKQLHLLNNFLEEFQKDHKRRQKNIIKMPKLRIFDCLSLRKQGINIKLSDKDEALLTQLQNFSFLEKTPIPRNLKTTLREYQKDGFYWLCYLYKTGFGACLADDMGLGKTIQAIALLGAVKEKIISPLNAQKNSTALIVLPPSLLFNWKHELLTFYPDFKILDYFGAHRETNFSKYNIILTSYDVIRRDISKLADFSFNIIIFDEAQFIKNIYASRTSAVRQLKGYFKLCLSGTPLENHLGEYYSILDLALPGILGNYEYFQKQIKNSSLNWILQRTKPFILRRTKNNILKDLPPKTNTDQYLDLSLEQKTIYLNLLKEVKNTISRAYEENSKQKANIISLTAILRLRQICLSPYLINQSLPTDSPKIDYLVDKLHELTAAGHNVLVFSQFTSCLDLLNQRLKKEKISFLRFDGKTPIVKRKKIVKTFQESSEPLVLTMSLKTGGVGLNLTRASYVFHLDPWWNPAVETQATDRTHRIGQKEKVFVFRLLMHNTIEEKMVALKEKKQALFEALLNENIIRSGNNVLTKEDFNYLLTHE